MTRRTRDGYDELDEALDGATPAARSKKRRADEPELPMLPPGCPVQALGKLGQVCYFLDEAGQLIALDPQKVGKNHIRNLFGRQSELCDQFWPRLNEKGEPKGHGQWHPEIAGDVLMRACAWAGIFDPQGKVRGRGAHRGEDGELVLHLGNEIYFAGDDNSGFMPPGLIGDYVYPTAPTIPAPAPDPAPPETAMALLETIRTWNWARPVIDPMLLLGWIGAALVGGALWWRPQVWVTGSSATGKSTLQKLLEWVFDGAALHTHDATEAALRQLLKQQTLPIFFDELEAEEDNRRNRAVIKLARLASSGAVIFRGGQDHEGHEFVARSCFLFSSILLPPMLNQDRNRLAVLDLKRFRADQRPPELDQRELAAMGRKLLRRMADQWHRFEDTLHEYRVALEAVGHGGRSQDQFGTLLACSDLLLYDETDPRVVIERADLLKASTLAEKATDLADEEEIVEFLAGTFLPAQRGGDEPEPIVRHIQAALEPDSEKANKRLENFGLRIVQVNVKDGGGVGASAPKIGTRPDELFLAVANSHEGLTRIFRDKRWADGVWSQSLCRVEGAHKRVKVRFAGANGQWSTVIPLKAMLAFDAEEE